MKSGSVRISVYRNSIGKYFPEENSSSILITSKIDTDDLFIEKLNLLLNIRENEFVSWSGKFRPPINNLPVYPRPIQNPVPIWLGVGGTPQSFARAGSMGLPLMIAIIGGNTHRFKPLVDIYRQAGKEAGHPPEKLSVGLHSLGYVANSMDEAINLYYEGYYKMFTKIADEGIFF